MPPRLWAHLTDFQCAALLSFIGGYIDAVGFVALFGMFTASITGNVVVAMAVVGSRTPYSGTATRLIIVATFVVCSAAGSLLNSVSRHRAGVTSRGVARLLLSLEAALLASYWGAGVALAPHLYADNAPAVQALAVLATAAAAFQNSCVREALSGFPPTTALTNTLAGFGSALGGAAAFSLAQCGALRLAPAPGSTLAAHAAKAREGLLVVSNPLVSFTLGALLGACLYSLIGFHCLCVPEALVLALVAQLFLAPAGEGAGAGMSAGASAAAGEKLSAEAVSLGSRTPEATATA